MSALAEDSGGGNEPLGLNQITNLARDVNNPSTEAFTKILTNRFKASQWGVNVGDSAVVTISVPQGAPVLQSSVATGSIRDSWEKQYKDVSEGRNAMPSTGPPEQVSDASLGAQSPTSPVRGPTMTIPAHVFSVANDALLQAKKTDRSQCIAFKGVDADNQLGLVLDYMLNIARMGKSSNKVQQKVSAARKLLRAFGNTTRVAENEPLVEQAKFTQVIDVLLDKTSSRRKFSGVKFSPINYDSSAVRANQPGKPFYPAFAYLLRGLDEEQRSTYILPAGFASNHCIAAGSAAGAPVLPDEMSRFLEIRSAMDTLGLGRRTRDGIFRMLSAILHLGVLEFAESSERGKNVNDKSNSCFVRNVDALDQVAGLLCVSPQQLESVLTSAILLDGTDRFSVLLNAKEAHERADAVASHLYRALFFWIVDMVNDKLSSKLSSKKAGGQQVTTDSAQPLAVRLIQLPQPFSGVEHVHGILNNYLLESLDRVIQQSLFDTRATEMKELNIPVPDVSYTANSDVFAAFDDAQSGLIPCLNEATLKDMKAAKGNNSAAHEWIPKAVKKFVTAAEGDGADQSTADTSAQRRTAITLEDETTAVVHHSFGDARYKGTKMLRQNSDLLFDDVVLLLRSGSGRNGSTSAVLRDMMNERIVSAFSESAIVEDAKEGKGRRSKRSRVPRRATVSSLFTKELVRLLEVLATSKIRVVFCLSHNMVRNSLQCDTRYVFDQIKEYNIVPLAMLIRQQKWLDLVVRLKNTEVTDRFRSLGLPPVHGQKRCLTSETVAGPVDGQRILDLMQYKSDTDYLLGSTHCYFTFAAWTRLEGVRRLIEIDRKKAAKRRGYTDDFSDAGSDLDSEYAESEADNESVAGRSTADSIASLMEDFNEGPIVENDKGAGKGEKKSEDVQEIELSSQRRRWLFFVKLMTWWIPERFITKCGGLQRPDVRMAWREKMAICCAIFWACAIQLFIIIGLGRVICPKQNIFNEEELFYKTSSDSSLIAVYGNVYNLDDYISLGTFHPKDLMSIYAGLDVTAGFPRTPASYCEYASKYQPSFPAFFALASTVANGTDIQSRHSTFYSGGVTKAEQTVDKQLKKGRVANLAFSPETVASLSSKDLNTPRLMFIVDNQVYDMKWYVDAMPDANSDFFPSGVLTYIKSNAGKDLSNDPKWAALWRSDAALRSCFNNLMLKGVVDQRKSARCLVTNYVLLGFSCVVVFVIFIKFLAALQLGRAPKPEEFEKFVILQVPCYTEGDESLRKTLNSLAVTEYDDKRKLLFIVCDGNIIGSGNDRPTPRYVLDILGVDRSVDPEPLSFQSLGEGMRQHNMGKVYSGLYEIQGHLVPYIVVVKVGRTSETNRPGNRGKRDSQMILMRFLNRVYMEKPLSPLELEMYHHLKNVIGINPAFYELCLMVDADTEVLRDSVTRLVGVMHNDTSIMGCCGETRLSNERDTMMTMIQVYEYYISHHMAKAFESMFGSVTCLPGCFSMYRLRQPNKVIPVLCSSDLVEEYGDVNVDTLHKKNLLHLGEDRYLTTLMLKHYPNMRTCFAAHAKCDTIAPDRWNVLLSQRRRWINSTIHNLVELLNIPQLCGFCLFSMRFVVFLDLLSTFIQPGIVGYLVYLIYLVVVSLQEHDTGSFPLLSLILLAAIYGLQAIIFILKREFAHIGWMVIYILATPIFSFFIPLYAFWHMDDFSWGNTRVVVGDNGKKQIYIQEDEKFDLSMIPHKSWVDYEKEMVDYQSDEEEAPDYDVPIGGVLQNMARNKRMSSMYGGGLISTSRPTTMYGMKGFDMGISSGFSPVGTSNRASLISNRLSTASAYSGIMPASAASPKLDSGEITDAQIYTAIRTILASSNLMTITKREVRMELSRMFGGADLRSRKDSINMMIENALDQM